MEQIFYDADKIGIKLEIVGGLPVWEVHPALIHQKAIDNIRNTISPKNKSECKCIHYQDIYIRFPDGSLKRPDISVFCSEPKELYDAVTMVPTAVIEIISRGYEAKDMDIGPYFYISQGVRDVIVFNPDTTNVLHVRKTGTKRYISPVEIEFECGGACYF